MSSTSSHPAIMFYFFLKIKGYKWIIRIVIRQIFWRYTYDDATVCVRIIALTRTPAVCNYLVCTCSAGCNDTTWTHTKRINAHSVYLLYETVTGWWQIRILIISMVLNLIDQFLLVLYSYSYGKGFCLHFYSSFMKQVKNISS